MAKKTTQRKPARARKRMQEEPAAMPEVVAEMPPLAPEPVDIQPRFEEPQSPPKRRELWLVFFLTLIGTLIGVAIGFYFGAGSQPPGQPAEKPIVFESPRATSPAEYRNILVLLQDEVVENARVVKRRRESGAQLPINPAVASQFLKNDAWKAMINSGKIRGVQDLTLLRTLLNAYRHVEEIKLLVYKDLETPQASDRDVAAALDKLYPDAESALVEAAVQIDKEIARIK